jgi:hypothetical protein
LTTYARRKGVPVEVMDLVQLVQKALVGEKA